MRHQSVVLLEQGSQKWCVHIEGSRSAGRTAAFLNETRARLDLIDKSMDARHQDDTHADYKSGQDFHLTLVDVVDEYYDHPSIEEQGHASVNLYAGAMTDCETGKNYFGVNNDFSCDGIDGVIFSDREETHYETLTAFFASQPKMRA